MTTTPRTPLGRTALHLVQALDDLLERTGQERRVCAEWNGVAASFHSRTRRVDSPNLHPFDTTCRHLSAHERLAVAQSADRARDALAAFHAAWASHPQLAPCTWNILGWPKDRPSLGLLVEPRTTEPTHVWLHLGTLPYPEQGARMPLDRAIALLDKAWEGADQLDGPDHRLHALDALDGPTTPQETTWRGPMAGAREVWSTLAPFWITEDAWKERRFRLWSSHATLPQVDPPGPPQDATAVALDARWTVLAHTLRQRGVDGATFVMGRDGHALLHIGSVDADLQDAARAFLEDLVAWRPVLADSLALRCERRHATLHAFGGEVATPSDLYAAKDLSCDGPGWMITSSEGRGTSLLSAPFATATMAMDAGRMVLPKDARRFAAHTLWCDG